MSSFAPPVRRRALRRPVLRVIGSALAAVLIALTFAGCSGEGRTTLVFAFNKREAITFMQKIVNQYNASQNKVHVVTDTSGIATTAAGFVRGNPPDIMLANYKNESSRYVTHCTLTDLSGTAEAKRIRSDVKTLVNSVGECPGRTSVLPYSVMASGVIYNKTIFAKYNLQVPTTWDELIAVCKKLQAAGVTPFYGTFYDAWTDSQGWFDYAAGSSTDLTTLFEKMTEEGKDVGPDSQASFQKTLLPAMQKLMILVKNYTNKDANSKIYGDGNTAMANGKAAMYLQGPWAFSEIAKTNAKTNLGTFPLPMTNNVSDLKTSVNVDLGAMIPEQSKHQAEAKAFMAYLFQKKIIDSYNASQLGYGPTTDAAKVTDSRVVGLRSYYESGKFYAGPSFVLPQAIPIANLSQSIVLGSDPKSILATIDADWARIARRQ